jgi:hypothetical protein
MGTTSKPKEDWDPRSEDVLRDQRAAYDAMRERCPGAPLARMELKVVAEEVLGRAARIEPAPGKSPVIAVYPESGFASLPLSIRSQ